MVELDPRFTRLTKGQKDDLSVDLKFPKDGARDGILLFMAGNGTNDFQIVYVQDGKLIVNTKNSKPASFVLTQTLRPTSRTKIGLGWYLPYLMSSKTI